MNAVLKAGDENGRFDVRSFSERTANGVPGRGSVAVQIPVNPEVLALTNENARLSAELRQLREDTDKALETVREEAYQQAILDFQRDERAVQEMLAAHLDEVFGVFRSRIDRWESLSLAIAQTALSKIVQAPELYDQLLSGLIGFQIDQVRRDSILMVRVSPQDFPETESISRLVTGLEAGTLKIVSDERVRRGGCVLSLRIGEVESALDLKWAALVALFETLAEAGGK